MANNEGYGFIQPTDSLGDYNPTAAVVYQLLGRVRTVTLGMVQSVANTGLAVPAGLISVQPLVSIVDGMGNATPHGTIFNVPYFRFQSGTNAVVLDPQVGDIGILAICDRDISSVKASQVAAPPPSMRTFDFADAIYFGGILGPTPTQTIRFTATGITIADKNANQIIMAPGFVNVVTPVFQVNGVPVTIP